MHSHPLRARPDPASVLLLAVAALVLAAYAVGLAREQRRGRAWSPWRTLGFGAGMTLVIVAMAPPLAAIAHHDLRAHMTQHLLIGMLAPIGIVLGAPMTLALRSLSPLRARRVVAVLHARPTRWLAHPVTALALSLGGMIVLYGTPLYAAMHARPVLHVLVHVHFVAAGCLFAWSIAGVDRVGPARPSHRARLVVLFVAIAAHATLAKTMYALGWPVGTLHPVGEAQQAAQIMYYGGDLSELLLAIALFASWPYAQRRVVVTRARTSRRRSSLARPSSL